MPKSKVKTKYIWMDPRKHEAITWVDKRGLKHTKFFKIHNEIPKEIIKRLDFKPYKSLGNLPDEAISWETIKDFKVYPRLKAGDVLKLKSGKYILVGHVNKNLGVCDDCTNFSEKDIREIASLF